MGNFLVRSAFQTSDQPGLLNVHAHDAKRCPFHSQRLEIDGTQAIH